MFLESMVMPSENTTCVCVFVRVYISVVSRAFHVCSVCVGPVPLLFAGFQLTCQSR